MPLHSITRPVVKSFLAVAVEEGRITQNPAARYRRPSRYLAR